MKNKILLMIVRLRAQGLATGLVLWFMIWAGYNTTIGRVLDPGFPHASLDLIHGLRAFLPLMAGILAVIFLVAQRRRLAQILSLSPLTLLLYYTAVGVISSVFSENFIEALYWALMYGTLVLVLYGVLHGENPLKNLRAIIILNWVIAGLLALGLLVFFLIQPGALHSLTVNILICVQRPYEHLGDIQAGMESFGMAGSRPTGFGRYAGVAALVAFWYFLQSKKKLKMLWGALFVVFLLVLLFSKGKTEIIAYIAAMIFLLYFGKKLKSYLVLLLVGVIVLASLIIFYNIPCENITSVFSYVTGLVHRAPVAPIPVTMPTPLPAPVPVPTPAPTPVPISMVSPLPAKQDKTMSATTKPIISQQLSPGPIIAQSSDEQAKVTTKKILTLSGRTNGVWTDGWNLFLTSPLWGYGFQADRFFLDGQHAHNTLLHAMVQTGALGTIAFVIAYLWVFMMLYKLFKKELPPNEKVFLIEITAVLLFFMVRGITESLAFYSADWIFVAPMIAYVQILYFNTVKAV